MAKRRHNKDLPPKTDPAEHGGGRRRGYYTQREIEQLLCSRAGCGRHAYASWSGCADGNVHRPLCAECDVAINAQVLAWWGDPDYTEKVTAYIERVESLAGRPLQERPPV